MSSPDVSVLRTARQSFVTGASVPAGAAAAATAAPAAAAAAAPPADAVTLDMDQMRAQQQHRRQHHSASSHPSHSSDGQQRRQRKQHSAKKKKRSRHSVRKVPSPSDHFSGRYAVDVRGVTHSYDKKKDVLQQLDLQIEPGQIYGLLGPSGCGKTTLIKSLLAQLTPSEGRILVFGEVPGSALSQVPGVDVGYMPQEIALYAEFTVRQNLHFYAKMFQMTEDDFQQRSTYLCDLLDLQDPDGKNVGQLSGGQQRRASLACGLLHSPKLLILDEPTVGVDPDLRTKIWSYLMKMSKKEGTTILLTTHYIEEARRAHRVGLMRDGRMLRQGTPKEIMAQMKCKTLEAAFLKICRKDEKEHKDDEEDGEKKKKKKKKSANKREKRVQGNAASSDAGATSSSSDSDDADYMDSDALESEAEADALNEAGGEAAADEGDRTADSRRGGDGRVQDSPYAEDADYAKGGGGRDRSSSGSKKSFGNIKDDDFKQPLLDDDARSPGGYGKQTYARGSPPAGSPKHLQGDEEDGGHTHASSKGGKSVKGSATSDDEGSGAPPLEGWEKVSTTLALPRWPQLWGMCWKNLMRMFKGVGAMIFQFILPSIQVILFCVAIGKDPQHIRFGVVNHDAVGGLIPIPNITAIYHQQQQQQGLTLPYTNWDGGEAGQLASALSPHWRLLTDSNHTDVPSDFLSAALIGQLNGHFITRSYPSVAHARKAVSTNDVWGFIEFPTNFTQNTLARAVATMVSPLIPLQNDTLANSTLTYTLDMSNEQMTVFLVKALAESYSTVIDEFAPGLQKQSTLQMNEPVYGDADASFTDFVAPGIIITIAFSGSIGLTAITFVLDKKTGNLDRIWASGIRASEIMLAQVVTQLIIFVIQIGLLLIFGLLVFKLPLKGSGQHEHTERSSVFLLFFICILLGVTGMMFGLVIASKVSEERDAMQCALGSFFPALLLSGVMWPVEAIPMPLYQIALGLPTTWAAEAGRSIMSRGWGMEHRQVWLGVLVPAIWSFVFFLWAARSLRPKQ